MDFLNFVEMMRDEVLNVLTDAVNIEIHHVRKNNNQTKVGLVISSKYYKAAPTIYMEEFYERYMKGTDMFTLVSMVLDVYRQSRGKEICDFNQIQHYELMKGKICFKLVNYKKNEDIFDEIPHKSFLDLAVIYYLVLAEDEECRASLQINHEIMGNWGIDLETLDQVAMENTQRLLGTDCWQLSEWMYVLSNHYKVAGASLIRYPEVMHSMYEQLGENYYILPSSIHEVILVPESNVMTRLDLENLVREVNEKEVEAEEILSYRVYYYNGERIIL